MYFTLFPSRPHIIATTKGDFQESSSPVLAVGPAPMKRPVLLNYGTTFTSALADGDGLFHSSSNSVGQRWTVFCTGHIFPCSVAQGWKWDQMRWRV